MRSQPITPFMRDEFMTIPGNRWVMSHDFANLWTFGRLRVIVSGEEGWDHVSVSLETRCPTWNEMEFVKRSFFHVFEVAFQLHVPEDEHVNHMPYCLHLWRPQRVFIPRPPNRLVGGA